MNARAFGCLALGAVLLGACPSVRAEEVFVKYRGVVDLSGFRCQHTASSLVHRLCYRADAQYVVVLLQDTYYHYCRVPAGVVSAWLGAQSLGRFYNSSIKGRFDCRVGGVPGG